MNYQAYINSDEWKEKAEAIKQKRGGCCELCGMPGSIMSIHLHHKTYERIGNEQDDDLVCLCRLCHAKQHNKKPIFTSQEIYNILTSLGVTYTNDDPWFFYSYAKTILLELAQDDWTLFDEYNKINIRIVDAACLNRDRREFQFAMENDWLGYDSEYQYRVNSNYWEGWSE